MTGDRLSFDMRIHVWQGASIMNGTESQLSFARRR